MLATTYEAATTKQAVNPQKPIAERRVGMPAIPDNIDLYLNQEQMDALQTMQYFGWQLFFVRRSDLNNILPVIKHRENTEYAVLDADGDIIRNPDIGIRD